MNINYQDIVNSKVPLIMGVVNVTPDSFSDGEKYSTTELALEHSIKLIADGADILDVGGESTRPGADAISSEVELERVLPVIKELINIYPDLTISIDTTKSDVAEKCVIAGASIINDISGGTFDTNMFKVAANINVPIIIMHIKGTPKDMQDSPEYQNVVFEINKYFEERISTANDFGVTQIILDPGFGFGKRLEDNYSILQNLNNFTKLNYPILIGVSKKSFLGNSLDLQIDERENSTIIAETIAATNGAQVIRTHNVKNAVELKNMISFTNQ